MSSVQIEIKLLYLWMTPFQLTHAWCLPYKREHQSQQQIYVSLHSASFVQFLMMTPHMASAPSAQTTFYFHHHSQSKGKCKQPCTLLLFLNSYAPSQYLDLFPYIDSFLHIAENHFFFFYRQLWFFGTYILHFSSYTQFPLTRVLWWMETKHPHFFRLIWSIESSCTKSV